VLVNFSAAARFSSSALFLGVTFVLDVGSFLGVGFVPGALRARFRFLFLPEPAASMKRSFSEPHAAHFSVIRWAK